MYLIMTGRCAECGDELSEKHIREYGLICYVCIHEIAELRREKLVDCPESTQKLLIVDR